MNPLQALQATRNMEKEMRKAKSMSVDVGLISSKVSGKVYNTGATVLEVGYYHEYGAGDLPKRSFLRTPFLIKQKEISAMINMQFNAVWSGKSDAESAMGRIGAYATNISQGAFTTKGYGTWQDIEQSTKDAKGSSQVLIDTGMLRQSIAWMVNK